MRKITFLVMIILSCLACSDGKSEYIQSVSHVNSLINEYRCLLYTSPSPRDTR